MFGAKSTLPETIKLTQHGAIAIKFTKGWQAQPAVCRTTIRYALCACQEQRVTCRTAATPAAHKQAAARGRAAHLFAQICELSQATLRCFLRTSRQKGRPCW